MQGAISVIWITYLFSPMISRKFIKFYTTAVNVAGDTLKLSLKPKVSGKTADGVPFLGFLVKLSGIYLHQKTKKRYKARIEEIEHKREQDILTELDAGRRIESVTSHLLIARSLNFRNTV